MNRISLAAIVPLVAGATVSAQFKTFVSVKAEQLMDGDQELRFLFFSIPNLYSIEDNQEFTNPSSWRPADEFEIREALTAIKQPGGRVVRLYTPSVRMAKDDPGIVRHVNGPGVFDEDAFSPVLRKTKMEFRTMDP
jgi:mannan endo-1,4-beta-mannosidase